MPGASGTKYEQLAAGRSAEEYFAELQQPQQKPADEQQTPGGTGSPSGEGSPTAGDGAPGDPDGDDQADDAAAGEAAEDARPTDPGRCGGVIDPTDDSGSPSDPAEARQLEAEWSVNVAAAQQAAKRRGTLSAGLERIIGETLTPAVDWKAALREFIARPAKRDYNWKRPNRRHIHAGLYLPSLHSLEIGDIVAAVDTSGSIDQATLTRFASELDDIARQGAASVTILYHDSDVVKVEHWTPDDGPLTLTPCGGGGTDHRPVFDWIEANAEAPPAVFIGLTDLASRFPNTAPDYPVLWASTDRHAAAPFGERVEIPAE